MKLLVPPVYQVDEQTVRKDPIRQLAERAKEVEGTIASYTGQRVKGYIFQPEDESQQILIVPPRTKVAPDNHPLVIASSFNPERAHNDLSEGTWLSRPGVSLFGTAAGPIQEVLNSWDRAFFYQKEDRARDVRGFRSPQLGALHALQGHWAVSRETATIVMPTGTGKTETMLGILVSHGCPRLLVVVPTDALRSQITGKFVSLGLLKDPGIGILSAAAQYPIVCALEHIPMSPKEIDSLFERSQVVVTTSAIVGQCSDAVQEQFAARCPYLFIDEAHHAEAPTWSRFKERFSERHIVQFTATPFREDGKPLDGKLIFKYPLKKAQEEGYFKPIRFEPVIEFDLRHADKAIADRAVARLRQDLDKGHILMARVDSIPRANEVFELYKEHSDLKPIQLHTGIKSARERENARCQLLAKESRIVVCVDMLGEGFDLPELKIAAFHDIRKSLAVTLQLAGRFTRSRPDLGDATFIANVADVNVQEELQKLYTRDPDWNVLLPNLSEQLIGEQSSLQDFVRDFTAFPTEFPLKAIRPATSAVVYQTRCEAWFPERYKGGIPAADTCERLHHSVNHNENTLVVVAGRRLALQWTNAENIFDWQWELYIAYWDADRHLLFLNSSNNSGEFKDLANVLTGDKATLISGQRVFRVFGGIKRLRLQNVGLSEQIGRNVRYTGRMGSDVGTRLTEALRGNAQKSVLAGVGFEKGSQATIGASKKGRIWSHQRDRLDQFISWCRDIGAKLLDSSISPDDVLAGTLIPELLERRPELVPLSIDWPESVYTEPEKNWIITLNGKDHLLSGVSINLVRPSENGPLRFAVASENDVVEFELEIFGEETEADFRFNRFGDEAVSIKHGPRAQARPLESYFNTDPPVIWFVDGSALEGNQYVPLRTPQPPYSAETIVAWSWTGVDITNESQGEDRKADTIQAKVIKTLSDDASYVVIFDDDGAGEAADVVAIRIVGSFEKPTKMEVEFYHCKYSHRPEAGHRVADLYEVCGQAQKSIWWAASPTKKRDLFTHLMRRENLRKNADKPTRLDRGSLDMLQNLREMSRLVEVTFAIWIVQPGLSKQSVSPDQLRLLGVTNNHLWETYQLPFTVVANF